MLALYSAGELEGFLDTAFAALSRIVSCDYVSAFYRPVGKAFLRERDSRGRVWGGAFLRRYVGLTPAIPLVTANPGIEVIATRFALTMPDMPDVELHRTAFYRDVMLRQGWRHAAVLCFWAHPKTFPILVLSLYRSEGCPDFTDEELALLGRAHPFIAPAVSRFYDLSTLNAVVRVLGRVLRHASRGMVVLDSQQQIVEANQQGRRAFAEWNGHRGQAAARAARRAPIVPMALRQVCNELNEELSALIRRSGKAETCLRRVSGSDHVREEAIVTALSLTSALIEPIFIVEFGTPSAAVADDGSTMIKQLTQSEREVASAVAEGLSKQEVAERLGKTVHAVKFLLHRVFSKLHIANRSRLGRLL